MNNDLLIIGAGIYGVVAGEIARSMNCFGRIAFIDDNAKATPHGVEVAGRFSDIGKLSGEYGNAIVAIGDPDIRLSLIRRIGEESICQVVSLISPKAYVSPTAQIMKGCVIEPMAVIHTGSVIGTGCFISAGAVVNHVSMCCAGVHVDCNATVAGYTVVPARTKVESGAVFSNKEADVRDMFTSRDNDPAAAESITSMM